MDKTDSISNMNIKIVILLTYVSNFWKTLEALSVNSKINFILFLRRSGNCVTERKIIFGITDKSYIFQV